MKTSQASQMHQSAKQFDCRRLAQSYFLVGEAGQTDADLVLAT
jgi:hypothetical protein